MRATMTLLTTCFLAMLALLSRPAFSGTGFSPVTAQPCPIITAEVAPCLDYIRSDGDKEPSPACCNGIKEVGDSVKSQADRQAVCECLKQALSHIGTYDPSLIPQLPKKCGVAISLPPIDKDTDCATAAFRHV